MLSSVLCLINLIVMLPGALVGCGTRNLSEGVQGASEFLSLCGISWKQDCFRRFWGKCPFLGHIFLSHRKVSFLFCVERFLTGGCRLCVDNHRAWECHKGHVVCIQLNACRIISGSRWSKKQSKITRINQTLLDRDKTLMINDFWLKTIDSLGPKETTTKRMSRFLNRPIFDL